VGQSLVDLMRAGGRRLVAQAGGVQRELPRPGPVGLRRLAAPRREADLLGQVGELPAGGGQRDRLIRQLVPGIRRASRSGGSSRWTWPNAA
jgi:hypothetical protein